MIILLVYELTGKYIMILYLMILFSSYANFLLCDRLLLNSPLSGCSNTSSTKVSQKVILGVTTFAYLIPFVLGFIPGVGANCRAEKIYRKESEETVTFSMTIARVFVLLFAINVVVSITIAI